MPRAYGEGGGAPRPPRPPRVPQLKIPGAIPDYLSLGKGSAQYQSWLANANWRKSNLGAARREAIRGLLLAYGGNLPGEFQDAYGDIDQQLRDAAANNSNSQVAQMARMFQQRSAAEEDVRTSRGILGSNIGQELFEQRQAATDRSQAESEQLQQLLAALRGALGEYTTGVGDVEAEESDVLGKAIEDARAANPPGEDTTAQYEQGSEEKYGRPVYKSASGKRYIIGDDGKPIEVGDTLVGGGVRPGGRGMRSAAAAARAAAGMVPNPQPRMTRREAARRAWRG